MFFSPTLCLPTLSTRDRAHHTHRGHPPPAHPHVIPLHQPTRPTRRCTSFRSAPRAGSLANPNPRGPPGRPKLLARDPRPPKRQRHEVWLAFTAFNAARVTSRCGGWGGLKRRRRTGPVAIGGHDLQWSCLRRPGDAPPSGGLLFCGLAPVLAVVAEATDSEKIAIIGL
jgi:hypothetical protein